VYNFLEKFFFGSSVAMQSDDQELCNEAKDFFDVPKDHQLYYSKSPWNYFSSFTQLTGTWIDKEIWDNLNLQEKIFIIYHEMAHKSLKHPLKQYTIALVTLILSAYCSNRYTSVLLAKRAAVLFNTAPNIWIKHIITAITSCIITTIISSFYSRQCEQEADEKAIEALCLQERSDIIEYEINYLKEILKDRGNISNLWFPSIKNQIQYFEDALNRHS
jgi:hypothetical protein